MEGDRVILPLLKNQERGGDADPKLELRYADREVDVVEVERRNSSIPD